MTTWTILTLVFTSSLLSAGLTSLVNWYIQKNNYRNEYYKKILDKRLESFEQVQYTLSLLSGTVQLSNGRSCVVQLAMGKEQYSKFLIQVYTSIQKSYWLSPKIGDSLLKLNVFFINDIENAIDDNGDYGSQLLELGVYHYKNIKKIRYDLEDELHTELSSLYDISAFSKPKPKSGAGHLIYSKPNPLPMPKENDTTKHPV